MSAPLTLLVDNGSLEPAATLRLRELARSLAARIGQGVAPVSLLHSSAIAPAKLQGVPAEILESALARRAETGTCDFLVVPLFFGPSRALTDYLPERVAYLRKRLPMLRVSLAEPLYRPDDGRLAEILAEHAREAGNPERTIVVDHGSPVREVTEVRNALAAQVGRRLGAGAHVASACMERRPGAEYDFAGPLLQDLLDSPGWNEGAVTIAMQFLLPGRHAGPAGDVARICAEAEGKNPGLRPRMTRLVGEHPLLIEILADRWRAARR